MGAGKAPSKRQGTSTVHISVEDCGSAGWLRGGKVASFKLRNSNVDLAGRFKDVFKKGYFFDLRGENIPYGWYDLTVEQPGFPHIERPVGVFKPDRTVVVCARSATVHLGFVDRSGRPDPRALAKVDRFAYEGYDAGDSFDLASRFRENTASNVPYGIYRLRVLPTWLLIPERKVDVWQPDVWVTIGVGNESFGDRAGSGPTWSIPGTVNNIDAGQEPLYVRALSVYADFVMDDKVNVSGSSGTFSLAASDPGGTFLLVTTGRSGVLDIRQIEIPSKTPIVIDLNKNQVNLPPH
jgi:hypothetical protein